VERAFGLLKARFRILKTNLDAETREKLSELIQGCLVIIERKNEQDNIPEAEVQAEMQAHAANQTGDQNYYGVGYNARHKRNVLKDYINSIHH
jgi:hypothetical protein